MVAGARHYAEKVFKYEVPPLGGQRTPQKTGRGWKTPGEHGIPNQPSREHTDSRRLKQQAQGLQGSAPGPLSMFMAANLFLFSFGFVRGLLTVGAGISLTLLPVLGTLPPIRLPYLALPYLALLYFAIISWRPDLF
jgi:hypothetical protein